MQEQTEGQATPRPWSVYLDKDNKSAQILDADNHEVAYLNYDADCCACCASLPANAALIVTAVNKHDALRAVADAARDFEHKASVYYADCNDDTDTDFVDARRTLRAALAALKGGA